MGLVLRSSEDGVPPGPGQRQAPLASSARSLGSRGGSRSHSMGTCPFTQSWDRPSFKRPAGGRSPRGEEGDGPGVWSCLYQGDPGQDNERLKTQAALGGIQSPTRTCHLSGSVTVRSTKYSENQSLPAHLFFPSIHPSTHLSIHHPSINSSFQPPTRPSIHSDSWWGEPCETLNLASSPTMVRDTWWPQTVSPLLTRANDPHLKDPSALLPPEQTSNQEGRQG